MATTQNEAQRCRERAAACRRVARQQVTSELRDSYLRLAQAHEILAEAVAQLDLTDEWFAAKLAPGSASGPQISTAG